METKSEGRPIHKLLIANRGEIAVRIIRACREMGILSVAVYSQADRDALHTQLADEAVCIGPAAAKDSYLNMETLISAAIATGADAIHPGFGFLSENSRFAQICESCHLLFVGPKSEVIAALGEKQQARETMIRAKVPVIPGSRRTYDNALEARVEAEHIGYPVMIKASLGGGGKGMRAAFAPSEFLGAFQTAQREAQAAFGDGKMYLEHLIQHPRHIEFQILADHHGHVVHLGERDCSIQRNHQKMLEEAPSVILGDKLREKMGGAAIRAARAAGYTNAGTVEFLVDQQQHFYFMEMNTRIQVEHPVTEAVTGIDLVKEQIRIAMGLPLSFEQKAVNMNGHAIECRINAEDPHEQFRPCPGVVSDLHLPGGKGVRVDSAIYRGCRISPYYDSMVAKVIVHGDNREEAIQKMRSALGEVIVEGVSTNVDFLYELMGQKEYQAGTYDMDFVEQFVAEQTEKSKKMVVS